eukprot:g57126.t1
MSLLQAKSPCQSTLKHKSPKADEVTKTTGPARATRESVPSLLKTVRIVMAKGFSGVLWKGKRPKQFFMLGGTDSQN